jgi:maltose/moltooligosaccharide transporter
MKLNTKKVFYVGLAFFLISLFWQTYDSVITKILIDKFGLNQTWSGVVMAFDNVLALFLLPLFGGLSDKTNAKLGRRTPYIIVGTVVAAFAFVALSFADNYQTKVIASETTIVTEYEAYLEEKAVMLDGVLTGDITKRKAALNEEYNTIEELYDAGDYTFDEYWAAIGAAFDEYEIWQADFNLYIAKWQTTNDTLLNEQMDALASGEISSTQYTRWYNNIYSVMNEIANTTNATTGIKQADYSYWADEVYDGVYDANLSASAWNMTTDKPGTFIVFVIVLFIALVSMATFRSPAVALMPDVTIKPMRSKANAIINLMGTFGGILSIIILTVFALDKQSYVNYTPAFVTVGILMLVLLAFFLWKVKEPKLVAEKAAEDEKYGLTEIEEAKVKGETVEELSREKRKSLYLILISVFLWFIGYNAVTTKLSDYAPKVLGMGYSLPLLIAQGAALIAFVPIGIIATKIGRRKTILIGITLLSLCFGSVFFISESTASFMYIVFALTGIGWATINVNSYPMVVELSKGSNVGKYTGYYYTFSMAAQILTPILSGILMDALGRKILFPYATLFVALAFITMFMVKHGDAQVVKKDSVLESFDVDMD